MVSQAIVNIGLGNDFDPRCQAITWNKDDLLSMEHLVTNINETWMKI